MNIKKVLRKSRALYFSKQFQFIITKSVLTITI